MKEKTTQNTQTPAWMQSEEFKAYDKNLRANQERGFQKKITQLKTEAEAREQRASQFKANLAKVARDPSYIHELKNIDVEQAREVFDTLWKDFFEASAAETKIEFPQLNLDREQIISEYKKEQASIARQSHIDRLFEEYNNRVEWDSPEEKFEFEKSANAILSWASEEQIDDLFGYACSKWQKDHLVNDVVANQMWYSWWNTSFQDTGVSAETIRAFDNL